MIIKHLVIPSGGPAGFVIYGALRELARQDVWDINNIKSIYGCSIGAILGAIISLKYKWDWLDDFFYKRPWDNVFQINPENLFNFYNKQGLLDSDIFYKILEPLLSGKNLSKNITMKEFYDITNIDLHIYTTNINSLSLEKIDINHITYPDIELCKAVTMSSAIPGMMPPVFLDDMCLIDGGCLNNFPVVDCIQQKDIKLDEILAFKHIWKKNTNLDDKSNIGDIYLKLIWALVEKSNVLLNKGYTEKLVYIVYLNSSGANDFSNWPNILKSQDTRTKLIEQGVIDAKMFCKYKL